MIIAPFVEKNLTLIDVCSYHKEGHVFLTRGISYTLIGGEFIVLTVYVPETFSITSSVEPFFQMWGISPTKQGLFLARTRTAEYLKVNKQKTDYVCTTLTTLSEDLRGRDIDSVMCVTSEESLGKILQELDNPTILYHLRKVISKNAMVIVVKTQDQEDTAWMNGSVPAYKP